MKIGVHANSKLVLEKIDFLNFVTIGVSRHRENKAYYLYKHFINQKINLCCHCLIDFSHLPYSLYLDFLQNEKGLELTLKKYIQDTILSFHQAKKWVVLNELFKENGFQRTKTRLSNGKWIIHPILKIPNWSQKIFTWASEVTDAELLYNDYRPQNPVKWNAILSFASQLNVHGIGIQYHHHLPKILLETGSHWNTSRKIIQKAKAINFNVSLTEVSIWSKSDVISRNMQALAYTQLAKMALDEGVDYFCLWNWCDNSIYHWGFKPTDKNAGLLDANYKAKPVYWSLKNLLQEHEQIKQISSESN